MRKTILAVFFILLAILLTLTASIAGDFEIKFGLLKKNNQGRYYVYKETTNIALIYKDQDPDYRFGYTVKGPSDKEFSTCAIMHFPSTAQQYSGEFKAAEKKLGGNKIQLPTKTSVGDFAYSFRFDKGDSPGPYKIDIWINDKPARTIDFMVISGEK